jgi:hypothetical protein
MTTNTEADVLALAKSHHVHELKTWPKPFQAVIDGRKLHEIRDQDRHFTEGDILHLREWNPDDTSYTGRETLVRVIYLTSGGEWGIPPGKCVMSITRALSRPVAEGFVLVPKEPTDEMIEAGADSVGKLNEDRRDGFDDIDNETYASVAYRRMIAAAPSEREDRRK